MAQTILASAPGARVITIPQFIDKIRRFMRDNPYLNRLTDGYESSDDDIVDAIVDAIDDFNQTPPFISSFNMSNPPPLSLLKRGVVICLLESLGLLDTRNSLQYADGGLNVNIDKTGAIQSWIQLFTNKYEEKKIRWKTSVNIENAQGLASISSEYILVNSQALAESF